MYQINDQFDEDSANICVAKCISPKLMRFLNSAENRKFKRQKRRKKVQKQNQSKELFSTDIPPKLQIKNVKSQKMIESRKQKKQIIINGNRFYGRIDQHGMNGKTQINFATGAKFKGKLINGKFFDGKFQFTNGYVYQGGYMNNKFFGQGNLICPDSKNISGDWNGQNIIGNGEIKYPSGQIYYGQIENFKKHGYGYLFMCDGSKYIGQFKEGRIDGKGSYFQDQKLVGQGYWQNGELKQSLSLETYSTKNLQSKIKKEESLCNPVKVYGSQFTQFATFSNTETKQKQKNVNNSQISEGVRIRSQNIEKDEEQSCVSTLSEFSFGNQE